ncbi:MAG: hypothetical protein D3919_00325 [Candidatus Electrothrix sp. AW5]|nr:hypothetical protein [Candidatus Electrothrix sp. AX1]MCI5183547.1 hypothetical protein [Candidatus Electrothrix gigas]MCI5192719.1 hypothetical protein [Candidatus Electrothrix gigas]MCI5194681.1 hypothetical protein [Candidatus Electrothrix gigas]
MALRQKDHRALIILVLALVVFAAVQFAIFPLLAEQKKLEQRIKSKKNGLTQMYTMQKEIKNLSSKSNSLEKMVSDRPADFSLFAFLEEKCAEAQVMQNISSMNPSDPTGDGAVQQMEVKMKLKAIQLKQLVALLERVESRQDVVALKRISIQINKKKRGTLDVLMHVITLVQPEIIGS